MNSLRMTPAPTIGKSQGGGKDRPGFDSDSATLGLPEHPL